MAMPPQPPSSSRSSCSRHQNRLLSPPHTGPRHIPVGQARAVGIGKGQGRRDEAGDQHVVPLGLGVELWNDAHRHRQHGGEARHAHPPAAGERRQAGREWAVGWVGGGGCRGCALQVQVRPASTACPACLLCPHAHSRRLLQAPNLASLTRGWRRPETRGAAARARPPSLPPSSRARRPPPPPLPESCP